MGISVTNHDTLDAALSLGAGADLHARKRLEQTPLFYACSEAGNACALILLEAGAHHR